MRVLYISYDGMSDQLGRSQVLPYLEGLAARGHEITLLSCEKPGRIEAEAQAIAEACRSAGIDWQPLRYHKRPPILSSMFDVAAMKRRAAAFQRRKRFDLVHCRSYLPAIVGHWLKRKYHVRFLFDMRGFWADERLERGFWPKDNALFRAAYGYFKRLERRFIRDADAIVSLTDRARREIESWPEEYRPRAAVTVIPCCVDLDLFEPGAGLARAAARQKLGLDENACVLVYVGSFGPVYLVDAMFDLFRSYRVRHPGARFLVVSTHDRTEVETLARERGIGAEELIIVAARRNEVPALIAAADLGVSFILPTYSAIASCPTKFGEMLAMGVPVVANTGVGDIAEIISESGAGAIVERFDEESLAGAIHEGENSGLDPDKVRAAAVHWFSLDDGIERYDSIYRSIQH